GRQLATTPPRAEGRPRGVWRSFLGPAIPAEWWAFPAPAAPEPDARALAWALRRLRFSRSAAPKRRCWLTFSARFPRSFMGCKTTTRRHATEAFWLRSAVEWLTLAPYAAVWQGSPHARSLPHRSIFAPGPALP